jgi:hypothetical protein
MLGKQKNGILDIKDPINKNRYLWKYFDLHRFLYFITERKLYLTRLDFLEDPYEGTSTSYLRAKAQIEYELNENKLKNENNKAALENKLKLLKNIENKNGHTENQNRQYVNCWYLGERESMAMWNIYSNEDSVAIKIKFETANEEFYRAFQELISINGKRVDVIGDQIVYLNLNPFNQDTDKQNLEYSALKKDTSYEHEKEYRFLIYSEKLDNQPLEFEVPIFIDKLELTVITHPKMNNWKIENIKRMINLSKVNVKLVKSSIELKSSS